MGLAGHEPYLYAVPVYKGVIADWHSSYRFSAKLPHREALSVSHNAGRGERTPDLSHPCTGLGKNVPWSPLQGLCPCGSLAKELGLL